MRSTGGNRVFLFLVCFLFLKGGIGVLIVNYIIVVHYQLNNGIIKQIQVSYRTSMFEILLDIFA